ncbi:hypothetical protein COCSADRAFT_348455 [Bipolaris sorokiniana ND90Pr]|uniref:Uncharacterized protein n=1 Tax=Cochliobolus sativus (strain ND90Pr / ATCC 201652) TaxID=665912 RepID=M2RV54_COCSN|nr:uncharacterized protein COCSADRAFT_348455 [Bipolaris sorokiniana ND90Pr]EMD58988.1 hypothetical protein COCSADRAFT_348455 [Bipolaris sorokiniana ND90Pr]
MILLGRLLKLVYDRLTRTQLRGGAVSLHRDDFRMAQRGRKKKQRWTTLQQAPLYIRIFPTTPSSDVQSQSVDQKKYSDLSWVRETWVVAEMTGLSLSACPKECLESSVSGGPYLPDCHRHTRSGRAGGRRARTGGTYGKIWGSPDTLFGRRPVLHSLHGMKSDCILRYAKAEETDLCGGLCWNLCFKTNSAIAPGAWYVIATSTLWSAALMPIPRQ